MTSEAEVKERGLKMPCRQKGETSQGVAGSLEDARTQGSLEPPEGMQSCWYLDFSPGRPMLET